MNSLKLFILTMCLLPISLNAGVKGQFVYRTGDSGEGWISRLQSAMGPPHKHHEKGLKVVWWNLGCLKDKDIDHLPKKKKRNELPKNLRRNLKRLVSRVGVRPDVLILGEYCEQAIQEGNNGLTHLLDTHFPYQEKIQRYTPFHVDRDGDENGIRIFSRYKIKEFKEIRPRASRWLEGKRLSKCAKKEEDKDKYERDRYKFPIIEFNLNKGGKDFQIVGAHSPNPWPVIEDCGNKIKAKMHVAWQMIFAKTNPAFKYANDLVKRYKNSKKTLVIGDFNAPKRIKVGFFHFVSKAYRHMAKYFGSSVIRTQKATGIGQTKKGKDRAYSIDHAFTSKDLRVDYAEVIPLAGSDHLPLYTVINHN